MRETLKGKIAIVVTTTSLLVACGSGAYAQELTACGDVFHNSYGPYDYRTASPEQKRLVEGSHFTANIESLRKGESSGNVARELDYTLRAFPNNPRALLAISKLSIQRKSERLGTPYRVDCYFERAVRFRPDDPWVRLAYGLHLVAWGRKDDARRQLEFADRAPIDDGNFHYNLGLAFLDVGDTDRALIHARKAYAAGYSLPGLQRRLEKLGKWQDTE
jgi:predicted Zn-dependent protease